MKIISAFLFIALQVSCSKTVITNFTYSLKNSSSSNIDIAFFDKSRKVKMMSLMSGESYEVPYIGKTEAGSISESIYLADSIVAVHKSGNIVSFLDCKKGGDCSVKNPFSLGFYDIINEVNFVYSFTERDFE